MNKGRGEEKKSKRRKEEKKAKNKERRKERSSKYFPTTLSGRIKLIPQLTVHQLEMFIFSQ